MWWNLIPSIFKIGSDIYKNRRESELLESQAERNYYDRMAKGEVEYIKEVYNEQDKSFKDEIVLAIICIPILVLSWSLFSGDPKAQEK